MEDLDEFINELEASGQLTLKTEAEIAAEEQAKADALKAEQEANEQAEKAKTEAANAEAEANKAKELAEQEKNKGTEEKSILDVLSSLEEKTEVELPDEVKAKLELAKKYEDFLNTDIGKLLSTDLTIEDLIQGVQVVDYSKMSVEQLIEAEAKLVAGDRFSEELLQEELDSYNSLTTKQKIQYEKDLVEKLGKSKTEIGNEIAKKINEYQLSKKPTQSIDLNQVAAQEKSALENTLTQLTEKGLDPEVSEGIKKFYNVEIAGAFVDKQGKFNEVDFIKTAYKVVAYDKEIAKLKEAAANKVLEAEQRGYEKAKKEFENASRQGSSSVTDTELSPDELFNSIDKL